MVLWILPEWIIERTFLVPIVSRVFLLCLCADREIFRSPISYKEFVLGVMYFILWRDFQVCFLILMMLTFVLISQIKDKRVPYIIHERCFMRKPVFTRVSLTLTGWLKFPFIEVQDLKVVPDIFSNFRFLDFSTTKISGRRKFHYLIRCGRWLLIRLFKFRLQPF